MPPAEAVSPEFCSRLPQESTRRPPSACAALRVCGLDMSLNDELPDELLPFKGRLSPRFYEKRRELVAFEASIEAGTVMFTP